jgi:AraC-like DNA-binding protein
MQTPTELTSSTAGSLVHSGVLMGAPALIKELGGNLALIGQQCGIHEQSFKESDNPLTVHQVVAFLALTSTSCGVTDFGLRLSTRQDFSVLGPIWPLIQNASTIGQLLNDLARYFILHTRGATVGLERRKDSITISYNLSSAIPIDDRQVIELGLGVLCNELRRHTPPGWQPRDVQLRYSAPADLHMHRQILGPNIRFNQDNNTVTLNAEVLNYPYLIANSQHHELISRMFNHQRSELVQSVTHNVEITIRSLLPFSECTLAQVCDVLTLSERTLQRRLKEANTSFNNIRDKVRADLALKYLRQSHLSCSEIAEILGYSDLTALSRAFRRWHGLTASQVRNEK